MQAAYALCWDITRARAKNFYYASWALPAQQRRAIYAAYAFCRRCDDIADGEAAVEHKRSALREARARLKEGDRRQAAGPRIRSAEAHY